MPDSDDFQIPPEQEQLHEILMKIVTYQHSLSDGRAVELDELRREGVLSPGDADFLMTHSVTYKPHRLSDYHASDMLHMPTAGGCVFVGPGGPPLTKRRASLNDFQSIVENFLRLPRPQDELLLHIDFTEHDGMGVAPEMICYNLQGAPWRARLPAIRRVAEEFGFHPFQDEEIQGSWLLTFRVAPDKARTAAAVVALLGRGCGFADETEITYSAGALDATS
jgi:hypothetical protein